VPKSQMADNLTGRLETTFATDLAKTPATTLRSGDSVDSYGASIPFDPEIDVVSDDYLTKYCWGVTYLDAESWRYYLPALGAFALRHLESNSLVVDALIASLRPPDREPPRLGSLDSVQEAVVRELLEVLAYSPESAHQAEACQALEEWWIDGALYRPTSS
jgi:hypothetical protein